MARVFVDTNVFIDLVEKRRVLSPKLFIGHVTFLSPLSIHILFYVAKQKIPYQILNTVVAQFLLIEFDRNITEAALSGPTSDFEDNVQLHSCTEADCDIFLTGDKELLKMKFFGKSRLLSPSEFQSFR